MKDIGEMVERSKTVFRRIIVPLDGSKKAERAIPVAAQLARASGGTIVFVRVVLPPMEYGKFSAPRLNAEEKQLYERSRSQATSYLAAMLLNHAYELVGIETEIGVATGLVAPTIFSVARRERADLIVLCGQEAVGVKRLMFGSVADEAILHSPVPVLALHDNGRAPFLPGAAHPLHVVVALDGSAQSASVVEAAVQLLAALAGSGQAILHLLRAIDLPREEALQEAETYLKNIVDRLHANNELSEKITITTTLIAEEDVAKAIALVGQDIERTEGPDANVVVVMAEEEHGKLWRLLMGSVTAWALHSTHFPLLVVHPHAVNNDVAGQEKTLKNQP